MLELEWEFVVGGVKGYAQEHARARATPPPHLKKACSYFNTLLLGLFMSLTHYTITAVGLIFSIVLLSLVHQYMAVVALRLRNMSRIYIYICV